MALEGQWTWWSVCKVGAGDTSFGIPGETLVWQNPTGHRLFWLQA